MYRTLDGLPLLTVLCKCKAMGGASEILINDSVCLTQSTQARCNTIWHLPISTFAHDVLN